MSFSGGVFSINTSGQPVVAGTTISASVFNALTSDLATGLSTCLLKDGTQTATAVIPFASGITLSGGTTLATYTQSTFTGTLTGCTTSPTTTVYYTKIGNTVIIQSGTLLSATSNATTKTITGMPAALFPTRTTNVIAMVLDNGGAYASGLCQIDTSGVMNFYSTVGGAAFTASGTAEIRQFTFAYQLA